MKIILWQDSSEAFDILEDAVNTFDIFDFENVGPAAALAVALEDFVIDDMKGEGSPLAGSFCFQDAVNTCDILVFEDIGPALALALEDFDIDDIEGEGSPCCFEDAVNTFDILVFEDVGPAPAFLLF